jgi:hypothetical protein
MLAAALPTDEHGAGEGIVALQVVEEGASPKR